MTINPISENWCTKCLVRDRAICHVLDDQAHAALRKIISVRTYSPGETVHSAAHGKYGFSLTSGILREVCRLPDGRRQITNFMFAGDFFYGQEHSLFMRDIEAITPVTLCSYRSEELDVLLDKYPVLQRYFLSLTRKSLQIARDNQLILGRLSPMEKIAGFLLFLACRENEGVKRVPNQTVTVSLTMPRADIADYLGLTIETVSRNFTKLKTQNYIRLLDAHTAEICLLDQICKLAGFQYNPLEPVNRYEMSNFFNE